MANPDFGTTGTLPVRIAGFDGLQMDLEGSDSPFSFSCSGWFGPDQLTRWATRLYLIDYPGESAQVLAIAVISSEADFERVIEVARPIVESLEIDAP
jgi:hypothetical protein